MRRLVTLKKRSDFQSLQTKGVKWVTPSFVVYAGLLPTARATHHAFSAAETVTYAVVASKKVGNAVQRNRCKRRLRAFIRCVLGEDASPGIAYAFYARSALATYEATKLKDDMQWALRHLHRQIQSHLSEKPSEPGLAT